LSGHSGSKRQAKKSTVNLFIDSNLLETLRKDALKKGISLNSIINGILAKYVQFYKRAEEQDDTCVIPKKYFQFVVDYIDVEDNAAKVAEVLLVWIPALFNDLNIPFTLENFIKYAMEQIGVGGRTVDNLTYHVDEHGNHCLAHSHKFGIRWSKTLSKAIATVIEELLKYRTECAVYPGSFVVKVLEKN
jgi:hypothetical protein